MRICTILGLAGTDDECLDGFSFRSACYRSKPEDAVTGWPSFTGSFDINPPLVLDNLTPRGS
jgi:hypothetical protein